MTPRDRGPFLDRPAVRRRLLLLGWLAAGAFLLVRTADLQLVQASEWRVRADQQHRAQGDVAAARGGILDRSGTPLALSHEAFRVSVAPHELTDRGEAVTLLAEALSLSPAQAHRVVQSDRRWVQLPQRYPPTVREALAGMRGVYVERELRRFYPHGDLARGLLGGVVDEVGAGGVEQELEEVLRGIPGSRIVGRDSEGRPIPGESWEVRAPIQGGDVLLTLDRDLQEIAREALEAALVETGAQGGDLIVTDPDSGEILAMVSLQDGSANVLSGINTPYEPGSTLKPFTVASLLRLRRASLSDSVDTGRGRWTTHGRTITDVSAVGTVTLAHALQVSSNVGIARVAERLTPAEQYEALRDFGFGVPTGIRLPGEVGGLLRHPRGWSRQSPASLAIGYEVSVTPLQMAMAYGALANGGLLMEPRIVKEVRAADGRRLEAFEARVVRRVVAEEVARKVTRVLVEAVEEGTGTRARLATFAVAGKSGTSRAVGPDGSYESGAYFSSFVGFFPADDPQLVVFVKLDRPRGVYYGGATAAPVTRATMEAVLAAPRPPLDRRALAAIARAHEEARQDAMELAAWEEEGGLSMVSQSEEGGARLGPGGRGGEVPVARVSRDAVPRSLFAVQEAAGSSGTTNSAGSFSPSSDPVPPLGGGTLLLPDVSGLLPRTAARRLHGAGLVVEWEGAGPIRRTEPRAGTYIVPGDTVRLISGTSNTSGGSPSLKTNAGLRVGGP